MTVVSVRGIIRGIGVMVMVSGNGLELVWDGSMVSVVV